MALEPLQQCLKAKQAHQPSLLVCCCGCTSLAIHRASATAASSEGRWCCMQGDGGDPQGDESAGAAAVGPYWSLMFEVSESQYKPVGQEPVLLGGSAGTWCATRPPQHGWQGGGHTQRHDRAAPTLIVDCLMQLLGLWGSASSCFPLKGELRWASMHLLLPDGTMEGGCRWCAQQPSEQVPSQAMSFCTRHVPLPLCDTVVVAAAALQWRGHSWWVPCVVPRVALNNAAAAHHLESRQSVVTGPLAHPRCSGSDAMHRPRCCALMLLLLLPPLLGCVGGQLMSPPGSV
jgi:hypothetical protein